MHFRHDRGQTSLIMVFGTAAFMVIATTLIVLLGRGFTTETQTRTAADAAALAAAESITAQLDSRRAAIPQLPMFAVPYLIQLLGTPASALTINANSEAARLAAANGSDLTSLAITPTAFGYEVEATVRARQTSVEGGSHRASFSGTASARVTSGLLCLRHGQIGLFLGGNCVGGGQIHLEPPAPPSDPSDPPADPPEDPVYPPVPWIFVDDDLDWLLDQIRNPLTWEVRLID